MLMVKVRAEPQRATTEPLAHVLAFPERTVPLSLVAHM